MNEQTRRDDLYLVESSCGFIKIGRSVDVKQRIKGLLTQSPPSVSLSLLAVVKDYGTHELTLHEAFEDRRVRGEWFDTSARDELRALVAAGTLVEFIERAALNQSMPRYVARNKRFAMVHAAIEREANRIAEQREQADRIRSERRGDRFIAVPCPACKVPVGERCRELRGVRTSGFHSARRAVADGREPDRRSLVYAKHYE